ncbi:hypothetical protein [Nocardioides convexus]|uniref:hypothetical protein n=1 Tax=Nocardioides convexus TaxID=2712224 RepID=UPI002418292C|nr:hypothetical protein [Nocardioides convexus]
MFLGGAAGPMLPGWVWALVKTTTVLAVVVWARRRLPGSTTRRVHGGRLDGAAPGGAHAGPGRRGHRSREGMSMVVDIAFWGLGLVAVLAGAAVFYVDSMARATYALAVSFIAVGVLVLFLQQNYVGVVTILMMVMEMAIMAVYMVMFMGMNPALMPMSMVHSNKAALAVAASTFALLATGILFIDWPARRGSPPGDVTSALGEEPDGPEDAGDGRDQPGHGRHDRGRRGAGRPPHPLRPVRRWPEAEPGR